MAGKLTFFSRLQLSQKEKITILFLDLCVRVCFMFRIFAISFGASVASCNLIIFYVLRESLKHGGLLQKILIGVGLVMVTIGLSMKKR